MNQATLRLAADSFLLDGTEFGINSQTSLLGFGSAERGDRTIDLTIHGDEETFARVEENPRWSWALYPPKFCLSGFPVSIDDSFTTLLTREECEENEVANYMMEHNSVDALLIHVVRNTSVEISGKAELMGKVVNFGIRWANAKTKT